MSIRITRAAIAALVASGLCNVAGATDCPADLDQSGTVNGADLAQLIQAWGASDGFGDLTGDGMVDGGDLGMLLLGWGACPGVCLTEFAWQDGFEFEVVGDPDPWGLGVYSLKAYDDGSGNALYVGGNFSTAGNIEASNIARWDGNNWTPLGGGFNGPVYAIEVFDDGTGPALYAAGDFTSADNQAARSIAKWTGTTWVPLGEGVDGRVRAIAVFDDGAGEGLFVGGTFDSAGGLFAQSVARWDGNTWHPLGAGLQNGSSSPAGVNCLHVHDSGGGEGPMLYAAGMITRSGPTPARNIARWDGTVWSPVGEGVPTIAWGMATVSIDGDESLIVGGLDFPAFCNLWSWSQEEWSAIAQGCAYEDDSYCFACKCNLGGCWSLTNLYSPESNLFPDLVFGGGSCGGLGWTSAGITQLGSGLGIEPASSYGPPYPVVLAWEEFDDGGGPQLIAGGPFNRAGDTWVNGLAAWDAHVWRSVGGGVSTLGTPAKGMNSGVSALVACDTLDGPTLYAGGSFTTADGIDANGLAQWREDMWTPLADGIGVTCTEFPPGSVVALTAIEGFAASLLYAGGFFTTAGGAEANHIAKWDGTAWSPLGSGMAGDYPAVDALAVFDDGSGPALYVGGYFTTAGGTEANRIAKWDGQSWSALGTGMSSGVSALTVFDDGTGPALYAGGYFTTAGGTEANRIAKWDGTAWSPLGSGMAGDYPAVNALAVFDDGSGPALYVGGYFTTAGGTEANRIAKWDGESWSTLGSGMNRGVDALAVFDDGTGPALYAGGSFTEAGGVSSSRVAKWSCGAPGSHAWSGVRRVNTREQSSPARLGLDALPMQVMGPSHWGVSASSIEVTETSSGGTQNVGRERH